MKQFMCSLVKLYKSIVLLLILSPFYSYSQSLHSLIGKVTDLNGELISSGTVQLLTINDSKLVKYADFNSGSFIFQEITEGSYLMKVSCVGFYDTVINIDLSKNTSLTIRLKENEQVLKEVQIKGSKNMFSYKQGNMKVSIENTILSKIADPVSLLTKLPSIQLSSNGESLNIIGKGQPLLYLDNQKITLNELNSLSVNDIKSVEIINNPSSKYEAEGRTVILILRNRNTKSGTKAVISETASIKRYFQNRSAINFNYKQNKLEFRANIQHNHLNQWESNSNAFDISDRSISSDYKVLSTGLRRQLIIGGGVYYQINDNDYFSLNVSNKFQDDRFINATHSNISQGSSIDHVLTENKNNDTRPFFTSSMNYNRKFKDLNGQLFIGAGYSKSSQELNSSIYNNYNNTKTNLNQDRVQNFGIKVFSGRMDYEQSFYNNVKWETGTAISSARSNSFLAMQDYDPFKHVSSDFNYEEQVLAAYTQVSGKTTKLSYTAGLRLENTQVRGEGSEIGVLVKKDYLNFFPKAGITLQLTENKSLVFNYAKSITRPNYASASQITTYINPFFEWSNNINIDPTTKDEISAVFQFKQTSLGFTYYRLKNPVYYAIQYDDQLSRLRMVNANYELETGVNLSLTVPFKYKTITSTNVLTGILNKVKDPLAVLNKSTPYLYFYSNNQIELPKGYSLMINGWGYTNRVEGIFERNAMYAVDFSLSKTFLEKFSVIMSLNSLLSSSLYKENFTINNISSKGIYYQNVREFAIGIKYSVGGIKDSKYKNKAVDDNINRL